MSTTNKMSLLPLAAACAMALAGAAHAQSTTGASGTAGTSAGMARSGSASMPGTGATMAADRTFAMKAAQGGMAEVAAGQAAQEKGASDATKTYGKQLVDDHSKANDELKQIAGGKGIELPTAPDAEHQKAMARMQSMSGPAFDKAFKAQMIADHKKTIALFQKEASSGKDAELKQFAAKTLPALQDHLKMAQALR